MGILISLGGSEGVKQCCTGKEPEVLTRRDCVSKVPEVFDPLGKVASIIGGMKIDMHELITRKLDWDDQIPDELKCGWLKNFETIQELRNVTFNRAIVPGNAENLQIETLDTADAMYNFENKETSFLSNSLFLPDEHLVTLLETLIVFNCIFSMTANTDFSLE